MALISWQPNYSVNIKEIDLQHRKLIDLINHLHDAMKTGKGKEVMSKILSELVDYTNYHFGNEEKLFDKHGYSESRTHKRQHADLVKQVVSYKNDFENGKSLLTMDLMNFLKDWLTKHILDSDKQYSSFLNSKGVV
jgi:hemerythrin